MVKRIKRLKKGVESLKEEVEKHFVKLEQDIEDGQIDRGRYHFKEIDKSLLLAIDRKFKFLKIESNLVEQYRKRLGELRGRLFG